MLPSLLILQLYVQIFLLIFVSLTEYVIRSLEIKIIDLKFFIEIF